MSNNLIHEFDHIKKQYRDLLIDWYIEGLTYIEIAKKRDLPLGTVKSRLSRGRDKINWDIRRAFKLGGKDD